MPITPTKIVFFRQIAKNSPNSLLFLKVFTKFAFEMIQNTADESHQPGRIEVVCGSMFSGKTEELIRRMKRARYARQRLIIFKPSIDNRYSKDDVVSHDHNAIPSTPIEKASEILDKCGEVDVVGIDEAQFLDDEIVEVCATLAARGIRVIIAGLDMDYQCKPFGAMPQLMAIADDVLKVHAICIRCGHDAYVSHRKVDVDGQVMIGEKQEYEPLCRDCFLEEQARVTGYIAKLF